MTKHRPNKRVDLLRVEVIPVKRVPKHAESVPDPDPESCAMLVRPTVSARSRPPASKVKIVRGVHVGELRMLCDLLRGPPPITLKSGEVVIPKSRPLSPEVRELAAATLEKLFFGEPAGALEYTRKSRALRDWLRRAYFEALMTEGKSRDDALGDLAETAGITLESAQRLFRKKPADKL